MAKFKIPDQHVGGLVAIRSLQGAAIDELLAALASVAPSVRIKPIITATSSATSIPQQTARQIVATLTSLIAVADYSEMSTDNLAEDVCRAMEESERTELRLGPDREIFRERLARLLNVNALYLAARAQALSNEYEHIFCSGRILTDARPVYGHDVSEAPTATLIFHTLRLAYHGAENRLDEIYITMDNSDLAELKNLLDRAETKAKSLEKSLTAAGMRIIKE